MAASDGQETAPISGTSSLITSFRGAFQAMSDWGDEVEKKHFNGDFIKTISEAPRNAASKLGESLEDIERKHFDGDFEAALSRRVDQVVDKTQKIHEIVPDSFMQRVGGVVAASASATATSLWASDDPACGASAAELLERVSRLQDDLAATRESHRSRALELIRLSETLDALPAEIAAEREQLSRSQEIRAEADALSDEAWREFEELQEAHHALLVTRASLEAALRRETIAADLAARAARHAPSPETEALRDAKVELAEALTSIDEARLRSRRELAALQRELEAAQAEHAQLQRLGAESSAKTPRRGFFGLLAA